jgi:hypothetical protein
MKVIGPGITLQVRGRDKVMEPYKLNGATVRLCARPLQEGALPAPGQSQR